MVNRGPSRGCITCKQRRVKCDETKPTCKECARVRRDCAGYAKKSIRWQFKDETTRYPNILPQHRAICKFTTKHNGQQARVEKDSPSSVAPLDLSPSCVAISGSLEHNQQDLAVAFYLRYVTDVGRNVESTRGFLEFVQPVLANHRCSSAVSSAVEAISVKMWALLRPSSVPLDLPIQLHSQALERLQQAISNPAEQANDATIIAALLLQQHDIMSALFDQNKGRSTHRAGALALLTQGKDSMTNLKYRGYFLGNLAHSKISSCVRHQIPLSDSELLWLQTDVVPILPNNPSSRLDIIGISVSRLQSAVKDIRSLYGETTTTKPRELAALIYDLDILLLTWWDTTPHIWRPRRIQSDGLTTARSIPTYHGSYDIYPSLQIADLYNAWQIYSLIVEYAKLFWTQKARIGREKAAPTTDVHRPRNIEHLFDSICRSLPFCLGNCSQRLGKHSQRLSWTDIIDPDLFFPSYHDLSPTDEALQIYRKSEYYVSKIDHNRQLLLHGPLHALSVMSTLKGLFSEESLGATGPALHSQKEWLEEQFDRTLDLGGFKSPDCKVKAQFSKLTKSAESVRDALWTLNVV